MFLADTPDIEDNSMRVSPVSRSGKFAGSEFCINVDNCLALALAAISARFVMVL